MAGTVEEEVVRVQLFIAEKLEQSAMECVSAAFGDDVDVCARVLSVRGVVLPDLHLELLNGIGIRNRDTSAETPAVLNIVGAHAIHLIVVVLDMDTASGEIAESPAATAEFGRVGHIGGDSRIQSDDLGVIACHQGQIDNHLLVGHASKGARFGLQLFGFRGHRDLLAQRAHFEAGIQSLGLGHVHANIGIARQLEARFGDVHAIEARR